nr:PREDICTED: E3 ubiquitin-protein ligase HUWE1 [Lepisosteus oculatus]
MKVDRSKLKKTPTEAPADCRTLIDKLKACSDEQLLLELQQIKTWNIGKCELYHWVDLLDRFDGILCDAGQTVENMSWMLVCDRPENGQLKSLLLGVLNFTALLIEYSFSRHLYSSIEHLTTLLASCDMQVVLAVLNLLYVFSKRSNYITRLGSDKRAPLLARLQHLAESWGGKENGFGLAECCRDLPMSKYPPSATTLHFEFYAEPSTEVKVDRKSTSNTLHYIHIEQLDKISESPSEIMESLTMMYSIPKDKQILLFTHIRLAHGFSNHKKRLQAVQARLHAISILVYSNALQESANSILYNGLIEELVDVLQITDKQLVDIKAASLRTLTSIVHLERTPKLSNIIDCTGTASYHGFLPVLVRNCIQAMIDPMMEPYPHQFATALFSFLYHLASYDAGGEALVSCGMMEALLKVIKFLGDEQDQITFVTRAVRVVDLITNLDMAAFQSHSGLSIFICRLEHEVDLCRKECPFVIKPKIQRPSTATETEEMETDMEVADVAMESSSPGPSTSVEQRAETEARAQSSTAYTPRAGVQCIPQRAALLKSMLNFLKKAIQDPAFSDGIRHVMDGSLPTSLKHIISNAEYYGPSLFLLATEVVTVFVFQEPSLLSSLQDNGLTDVMLHALLIKDVPATREVLGSLPNVFSALCLNARGLQSFVQCQPFERLFKVLLSPDYLPAMRRRRSSDPLGDTASNLGSAVDELMRHQPTLKTDATTAIIKLLEEICNLGRAPEYICQKPSIQKADGSVSAPPPRSSHAAEEASSEDEEEEEQLHTFAQPGETESSRQVVGTEERIPIPLMDYILNVMKFVESILSNNTTDDHCQEFVSQKGLLPLVSILGLPNLPIDFPTSAACQAVAGVCKSILTLSHEPKVLQEGLCQLEGILSSLEPLHRPIESPGGSVLLRELAAAAPLPDPTLSAHATPLLHALTAAHAYIMMFVHTCRVGQSEIRAISVNQWGSQLGLSVLNKLSQLYCSLVWESTVLLSLCTPNSLPPGCEFGQADMQKLVPKEDRAPGTATTTTAGARRTEGDPEPGAAVGTADPSAQGLLEGMGLDGDALAPMETDEPSVADAKGKSKLTPAMAARIKQIKPLLSASSRLGRALAELFGLLVKLCVGSPVRQRRSHHAASASTAPTPAARATASSLTRLLTKGLSWQPPPYTPTPRFRLTFFICSVGFTSPMLFDERKYPYHLMLQKFFCSGGHDALFETFNWALSMGGKVPISEGLEHTELPDGTGEFLDAWLMLVEKMVNPTTVLDSPHALPAKLPGAAPNTPQFSALRFLIVTQKAAFSCIQSLWNRKPLKVYGGRMAESMLAILCHILRGEPAIRERLAKEREGGRAAEEEGSAPPEEGSAPRREPQVNQQQLQQLMDMGFTREHAMEALLNTSTMEQATEYLLTHPPPLLGGVVRDLSMSEEDQMMRAIAMSLGQEVSMEQRSDSPEVIHPHAPAPTRRARERAEEEEGRCLERFLEAEPLDSTELHNFTDTMLPGCFHLLDELPDTVYRVCDLIMTAIKRNGPEYRDMILRQVVNQVWEAADVLIKAALPLTTSDTKTVSEWTSQMATLPQASNLATRILLLTLLFEELKLSCARVVETSGILNVLIKLLEVVQPCLQAAKEQKEVQTPKWITPVLLLIDFYEKTAVSSKRRAQMNKYLQPNGNNWRWFDDRSGRWCSYSASNNSTIDTAWRGGESSVRFTAGRRRYTVQFNTMVQVNEETGNRRPVMLTVQRVPRIGKASKNGNGQELERAVEESKEAGERAKAENPHPDTVPPPAAVEMTPATKEKEQQQEKDATASLLPPSAPAATPTPAPVQLGPAGPAPGSSAPAQESPPEPAQAGVVIQGLSEDMTTVLIRACVSMISVPVDPDTLHATLRLCLRLTRTHHFAMMFAELKSTRMILGLTQSSGFNGFTPLVTLLFRHIIEDPATLKHTMEKVVRSAVTSGAGSTTSGVVSGSLGSREINYILRVLGPAACRNPECFTEVATNCIRIALPAPRGTGTASDDEFENLRIKGPNAVQLVKTTPLKLSPLPPIPEPIKEVIYDMLNALAAYHAPEEAERGEPRGVAASGSQELCQMLQDVGDDVYQQYRLTRQGSDYDAQTAFNINAQVFAADSSAAESSQSGTPQGEASTPEEARDGKKDREGERAAEDPRVKAKASKPLMPTSTILRLLAELVRSYVGIATLIASYCYTAGQSELIKEDCSVLAFVLDHLLPHTQNSEDKDTPALARLFLASLAAAGTGTDAQVALVNEVKAALSRALAMAESTEKHARLQAVMCIISTIMESCPSTSSFYSTAAAKTQHNGMNNIIRLFLKKGLVNDLARVPHSLDLSSPNMANTVNAALKPLETLSRIVNQPSSLFGSKSTSSKSKTEQDTAGTARDSNSNTQDTGEPGEAEPQEDSTPAAGTDNDLMDGEAEGDTVVIAGQPEVLNTQEMQVENELVDLIDELLERDAGTVNSAIIVGRSGEDESQEDVLMDEAPSNLSQASTLQANREDSMNILEPEDEEHTQEEDSSGSNEDEDSQDEEEEEEEEEEEDDQDDEEGDEDDDDDGSEMELDEDYPDINTAPHIRFERFDRDDDLIIEFDNMFSTTADIPPSPGNIPSTHPLMVRHADHSTLTLGGGAGGGRLAQGIGRSQRTLRQLTANTGHTIHVHYPGNRQPNPPLILQRLLGPSAAADILQLSSSLPLQSRGRARLLVGNDDVHIIARSDDELLDDFFHEQSSTGGQAGTLSSIPTALTRWTDECKVLDAESMHDCVAVVKVPIMQHLESLRDEELEERREKRRRQLAEEEEAKQSEKAPSGGEEGREQSLQGSGMRAVGATGQNSAEGDQAQCVSSCLDAPRGSEGFLTAPPSGEGTPTAPDALVTLETAVAQQHQPIAELLQGGLLSETRSDALAALSGAELPELPASDRPSSEAEATQMEMSPAPTIASLSPERVEGSDALTAVSSQLEGSPMDTSSPASAGTLEEPAATATANEGARELPGGGVGVEPDSQREGDVSSAPVSSPGETLPQGETVDSQSQAIQEEPLPSTSNEDEDPLAGINLPEGVDPSFLAALPEDIRREVLQNQLGIRPPARPVATTTLPTPTPPLVGSAGVTEVSPEFLAALPPAIQEEVLAQQRAEQQRRELSQAPAGGDQHMDPVTFIQTLPSELRRSVLEDMEDSVLAVMPPDIAAEAQALRREQEARQRQLMHERLFGHSSSSALSAILRSPAFTSRLGGNRGVQYTRLAVQRGGAFQMGGSGTHTRPFVSLSFPYARELNDKPPLARGPPHVVVLALFSLSGVKSRSPVRSSDPVGDSKMASTGLTEKQLQLSVEVLTSHSCSEEGLEDAANILLQLSRGDAATRDTVLRLLLSGARQLGYTLCKQIGTLLAELREYNLEQQRRAQADAHSPDGTPNDAPHSTPLKGKMTSRFDTAENVVIVATQKRTLGGRELQLPSMSSLTSKTSTQKFFLRVLQVIIQLREDTRRANKKAKQTGRLGSSSLGSASSIQAAVRQLEAEADAIIQMVREGQRARRLQQGPAPAGTTAPSTAPAAASPAGSTPPAAAAAAAAAGAPSVALPGTASSATSEAAVSEPPPAQRDDSPMDVDQPSPLGQESSSLGGENSAQSEREEKLPDLPLLSEQLLLDELWDMLGECLKELEESHDQHAVLVLQPAVEAFFLVHATERESKPPVRDTRESQLAHIKDEPPPLSPAPLTPATPSSLDPFFSREPSSMHISANLPPDTQKFLRFAETHRTVLNQILRQSTTHLADGPFAVLVDYIRILDFDVKRKYFRQELERLDEGLRKEDMAVHVRRDHVFEDSYRELHRKSPEEMKNRLYIVFEGEEGQDAGGLLREWYMIISREMFNPMYALFRTSPGDRVTYTINPSSHCNPNHLSYFKFVGRVVAKAVYDNRLLECYFTRSFYKHILGKSVRYTDMESEDYHFYQGLVYLLENDVSTLGYELTFSTEVQEFGVCEVRDLKPNGANILVTEENKKEYVHLVCQMKMTGAIRKQLAAFLEGFYEIIPKRLISIFTEQELELLISGLPTIDIDDLKANTEYHKYQSSSIQIQWFWRALRSFDQADRAKFLQFVTGTSKVPLQGFAALEGMNGIQKFQIHRDDRSTDRLPSAHTCFNQLDLPAYESYEKLRHMLLLAIQECSEGFGLA